MSERRNSQQLMTVVRCACEVPPKTTTLANRYEIVVHSRVAECVLIVVAVADGELDLVVAGGMK